MINFEAEAKPVDSQRTVREGRQFRGEFNRASVG